MRKLLELKERDFFNEPFIEDEVRGLAEAVGTAQLSAWRSPGLTRMGMSGRELSEEEMVALMPRASPKAPVFWDGIPPAMPTARGRMWRSE